MNKKELMAWAAEKGCSVKRETLNKTLKAMGMEAQGDYSETDAEAFLAARQEIEAAGGNYDSVAERYGGIVTQRRASNTRAESSAKSAPQKKQPVEDFADPDSMNEFEQHLEEVMTTSTMQSMEKVADKIFSSQNIKKLAVATLKKKMVERWGDAGENYLNWNARRLDETVEIEPGERWDNQGLKYIDDAEVGDTPPPDGANFHNYTNNQGDNQAGSQGELQ